MTSIGRFAPLPIGDGDPLPPEDRAVDRVPMLDRLYRAQAPRLLRFFRRGPDFCEAEDLLNESFLRLIASPAVRENVVDNPEGYLTEIAKNALRNRARAAFHRSVLDLDSAPTHDGTDPIAALEARDMLARLQASLDRMPSKTRAIFMAHRLEGATYVELAEAHGLSVKGVEWHMSKAIAQLHRVAGTR